MTFCINLQKAIVYFCQILFDLLKIGYILLLWGFGIFVFDKVLSSQRVFIFFISGRLGHCFLYLVLVRVAVLQSTLTLRTFKVRAGKMA